MSFATNLTATQQEATPELYQFTVGARVDRYTTYPTNIDFGGEEYIATAIKRSDLTHKVEVGSVAISVVAEVTDLFIEYVTNAPLEPTQLKIYRVLFSDTTEYRLIFSGIMRHITFEGNVATMEFDEQAHVLSRRLGYVYQSFCNHEVFDKGCSLIGSAWRVSGTVSSLSGASITVAICSTKEDGFFTGGHVRAGTDARLITRHVGATLDLQMAFDSRVEEGTSVLVFPGCSGSPVVCEETFNNLTHYLGMPYIPSHNPAIWGFR